MRGSRTRSVVWVVAWAIGAALAGCDDGTEGGGGFRIGTFNAGLARGFVLFAEERAGLLPDAVLEEDLDILCLQEVWADDDWEALRAATEATYPHAHRLAASPAFADTCEPGELDALETCVIAECDEEDVEGLADCALLLCEEELGALSKTCQSCLIANVGGTLGDIKTACESDEPVPAYAYGGSFGLGILSKVPLEGATDLVFNSTANRRGVLAAAVDVGGPAMAHVFCTHLTANLGSVPYTGTAASWAEEQAAQVEELLEWMGETAPAGAPALLLGDVNSGPAVNGVLEELPENYALYGAAGWTSVNATAADAACTYCDGNPLNSDTAAGEGGLIDHIFVRDGSGLRLSPKRIFEAPVTLTVDGEVMESRLSDHYGVAAKVTAD